MKGFNTNLWFLIYTQHGVYAVNKKEPMFELMDEAQNDNSLSIENGCFKVTRFLGVYFFKPIEGVVIKRENFWYMEYRTIKYRTIT